MMLIYVTLFSLGAAMTDLRKGKIYNKYLLCAAGTGVLLRMVLEGAEMLPGSFLLAGKTFVILLPVYMFRALGGGDVKMLTATALLISRRELACTCLMAVALTLAVGLIRLFLNRMRGKRELTTIAFAVPFFCAVCFSVFGRVCIS